MTMSMQCHVTLVSGVTLVQVSCAVQSALQCRQAQQDFAVQASYTKCKILKPR
jgi:hypothetical protein